MTTQAATNDYISQAISGSLEGAKSSGYLTPKKDEKFNVSGILEVVMSAMSGGIDRNPSKGLGQLSNQQESTEQLKKLVELTQSQDQRLANMLQTVGTAAGGSAMGEDLRGDV